MSTARKQRIFRTQRTINYTTIPNELIRDKRLSYKARGVLILVLSNTDEWEVHQTWLEEQGTEGREAIRSAMQELKNLGYAVYTEEREKGKFVRACWTFHDVPTNGKPVDGKPANGKPSGGKPSDGKPSPKKDYGKENHGTEDYDKKGVLPEQKPVDDFFKLPPQTSPLPPILSTPAILEMWKGFGEMRKKMKKPMTDLAKSLIIKELLKYGPEGALQSLEKSTRNNWIDVYPPEADKPAKSANGSKPTTTTKPAPRKFTAADAT